MPNEQISKNIDKPQGDQSPFLINGAIERPNTSLGEIFDMYLKKVQLIMKKKK